MKTVEHAARVRDCRDVDQKLPALSESVPKRQSLPVGLTVHQHPLRTGAARPQVRCHVDRCDHFRSALRHHVRTGRSRHAVQQVKRVQVHHAKRRCHAVPVRPGAGRCRNALRGGSAGQEDEQGQRAQRAHKAEAQPRAAPPP